MRSTVAALALALAAACTTQAPPDEPEATSVVDVHEIPVSLDVRIDLLFVIDNSPAMAARATALAAQYRHMMDVLAQTPYEEAPDLRIGVVTTDLADGGRLRTGGFLVDAPRFAFRRERNYDGALGDAFANLASVGALGATDTQPLAALQRALAPGVNPGFLREGAVLGVVILTAADDHGTAAVEDIARALKTAKGDPDRVVVSVAAGCGSAPRLDAFVAQFPDRSAQVSLCDADLGPLIAVINQLVRIAIGLACLEQPPVVPHECSSWLIDPESDDQATLPECRDPNATHCWSLEFGNVACLPGSAALHFHPFAVPFPATAHLECVVAPP